MKIADGQKASGVMQVAADERSTPAALRSLKGLSEWFWTNAEMDAGCPRSNAC
jgi:hypothetical protein